MAPFRKDTTLRMSDIHTAAPISRAASRYCSHRRSSNAMVTLAWASQLQHHGLGVCICGPSESLL